MKKLFEIQPHVRSMIDDDGAVLLDLKAGKYYSLNGVAAAVWTRVEQDKEKGEILDELTSLYKVGREQLETDILSMAAGLQQKGLIRVGV